MHACVCTYKYVCLCMCASVYQFANGNMFKLKLARGFHAHLFSLSSVHCSPLFRRAHTESAKKWLSKLQEANIPVLVCLTFTDKLYTEISDEICGKDSEDYPPEEEMQRRLQNEMAV